MLLKAIVWLIELFDLFEEYRTYLNITKCRFFLNWISLS
jgi:hypothetical protein